jgi:hypothetical protein
MHISTKRPSSLRHCRHRQYRRRLILTGGLSLLLVALLTEDATRPAFGAHAVHQLAKGVEVAAAALAEAGFGRVPLRTLLCGAAADGNLCGRSAAGFQEDPWGRFVTTLRTLRLGPVASLQASAFILDHAPNVQDLSALGDGG